MSISLHKRKENGIIVVIGTIIWWLIIKLPYMILGKKNTFSIAGKVYFFILKYGIQTVSQGAILTQNGC